MQSELLSLLHRPKNEWLALKDGPVLIMIFHLQMAMNSGFPTKLVMAWGICSNESGYNLRNSSFLGKLMENVNPKSMRGIKT